jgi:hypothetical protein
MHWDPNKEVVSDLEGGHSSVHIEVDYYSNN